MRTRDLELDRLRAKLALIAAKERETGGRDRHVLALWRAGAVVGYSPSTGGGNMTPAGVIVVGGSVPVVSGGNGNGSGNGNTNGNGSGSGSGNGSGSRTAHGGAVTVTAGREEVNAVELVEALDRAREVSGADSGRGFEWG